MNDIPQVNIRIVEARTGRSPRLIVKDCPYCHSDHVHRYSPDDHQGNNYGTRLADCWGGEYELVLPE